MPDSTKRILTDETGQDIVSALEALTNVMTTVSLTDVTNTVTNWLNDNISTGQTVAVDQSLTISGAAADAKKTGDQLSDLESALGTIPSGKTAQSQITDNANDIADLQSTSAKKSPAIYEEIESVPLATFADGAEDMPLKDLKVAIEPVQDLHGYDHPWPAGGGKNKFPITATTITLNGTTFTVASDGAITISNTPSTQTRLLLNSLSITPSADMKFSMTGSATGVRTFAKATNSGSVTYPTISPFSTLGAGILYEQFIVEVNTTFSGTVTVKYQLEEGTTVTDWVPYENECPISGWTGAKVTRTGKNLIINDGYSSATINGVIYTKNADGSVTANGTNTGTDSIYGISINLPAGNYYFNVGNIDGSSTTVRALIWCDTDNIRAKNWVGTPSEDAINNILYKVKIDSGKMYHLLLAVRNGTTVENLVFKPMICASTETDPNFVPYSGTTLPISWQSEAGTVYGGTLDVTTGVLTVDREMVTFTRDASVSNSGTSGTSTWMSIRISLTSGHYGIRTPSGGDGIGVYSHGIWNYSSVANNWRAFIPTDTKYIQATVLSETYDLTTDSGRTAFWDWFEALGQDMQAVYPLATPITYQLTPQEVRTLLGLNNIWADTGDVSLLYPADTKAYIDNQIASTRKLIAGIEMGFTASKAYSVGDMLIIGDDLYKVSASIASGAMITVGTNVTKTTVAEQLIALANA